MNPSCRICGARLLRWAWYECDFEPCAWWYCLECDRAGREPCIQVFAKEKTMDLEKLREQLIRHEGLRLRPYRCTGNKLTIGVGRNLEDRGISKEEAMIFLDNDLKRCIEECRHNIPVFDSLSEPRQHVLVDMCFNLGMAGMMKFRKMLSALESGSYHLAADEMMNSRWARQVQAERRDGLVSMMREG